MMKKNIKKSIYLAGILAVLLAFSSCEKEPEAPELPPVEQVSMDFSDFEDNSAGTKSTDSRHHFTHSSFVVAYWNAASRIVMALPVAAYEYALSMEPVQVDEGDWEWSYEYSYEDQTYLVILTAIELDDDKFSLEMELALPAYPDFRTTWFDAVISNDHSEAEWNFYYGQTELLGVDWTQEDDGSAVLQYTFIENGEGEQDSYIRYEHHPEQDLDAAFRSSLTSGQVDIEWNTLSLNGRVKSPEAYGDELWHCWDTLANGLADIDCE